jgi:hypothetical protein
MGAKRATLNQSCCMKDEGRPLGAGLQDKVLNLQALNLIRYPWEVSSAKLEQELGYNYQYTTLKAFDAFAEYVRSIQRQGV